MKYFKPGMMVRFPFDSYCFVIILKVLISEHTQSFCLVLTDEVLVIGVWLYEDINKEIK